MTTQEKLDEITEFIELFVPEDQERARLNLEHLIDQARKEGAIEELEAISGYSLGLVYTSSGVDKSQRNWTPIPVDERIKQLKGDKA